MTHIADELRRAGVFPEHTATTWYLSGSVKDWEVWLYDESKRYEARAYPGFWYARLLVFDKNVVVANVLLPLTWNPSAFNYDGRSAGQ
jgi:hypothetical protein